MFSNHLISSLTARKSYEPIDSLTTLLKSEVKLGVLNISVAKLQNRRFILNQILNNTKDNEINEFLTNVKWITRLFERRYAIAMFTAPFKRALVLFSTKLDHNWNIISLNDFRPDLLIAIPINRKLDTNVRKTLKIR